MRRMLPLRLGLGLFLGLTLLTGLTPADAQDKKDPAKKPEEKTGDFERVRFDTVDQVELHGTFYPSTKGKRASCVLLLHALGKDSQQEGWDKLAKELQSKGYAVLAFDFRGHGKSDRVDMPAREDVAVDPVSSDDDVRQEITSLKYDLAGPLLEELILAIDPYPRKAEAVFEAPPAGDGSGHPFAALAALKKGQGDKDG